MVLRFARRRARRGGALRRQMAHVAAGIVCIAADTRRILFLRRSPRVKKSGLWSCPAGRLDPGEVPLEAAIREFAEEAGYSGPYTIVEHFMDPARRFHHFVAVSPTEFAPRLNWESDASGWFCVSQPPRPLHPGIVPMLGHLRSRGTMPVGARLR